MSYHSLYIFYFKLNNIAKSLLFIVLFLLVISISKALFHSSSTHLETFENYDTELVNSNLYDDFYASIYDFITFDKSKNDFEIEKIIDLTNPNMNSIILDIGCGMGHHVNALHQNYCGKVYGIDQSYHMVNYAKTLYPDLSGSFFNVDIRYNNFPQHHFSHILCLFFTIYYIPEQQLFFKNCFNLLQNNGFLILHLVDKNSITTLLRPDYVNGISYNYLPKTTIDFNKFTYSSHLDSSSDSNIILFKEQFAFKNGKKRTHNHSLFLNEHENILNIARKVGFIISSVIDMKSCNYNNHFLYILKKPF